MCIKEEEMDIEVCREIFSSGEELSEDRISQVKHTLFYAKKAILIVRFSRGDSIKDLVDGYKELLTLFTELWHLENWSYSDGLDLMSIGKLLRLDDLIKETYIPLLESANIKDWLYNFILLEKNTDVPLLWKRPYQGLQDVVTTKDITKVAFLRNYLNKMWYRGNSDAGWYDAHKESGYIYYGYWSWEAGAVAKILGLDDESLKEQQYYPYDLVHFKAK